VISTSFQTVTVQPFQVMPKALAGSVFFCLTATAPFNVSFDGSPYMEMVAGMELDNRPNTWSSVTFQNLSNQAITINYYVGNCAISYSPTTVNVVVTDAPTYSLGTGLLNAEITRPPATPAYPGYDATNGNAPRKQIIITNLDATNAVTILDAEGNVFASVPAGQAWTVESSAGFSVLNPYSVSYIVGEVFYDL
jgi:hypothetical protein